MVLKHIKNLLHKGSALSENTGTPARQAAPGTHPYKDLPDHQYWRRSVSSVPAENIDPVVEAPFTISKDMHIATVGSCFAQHISRYLLANDYRYFVTEKAHPLLSEDQIEKHNYGVFPARFGNVYTAAQLKQLHARAYGEDRWDEKPWLLENGRLVDPFRPLIEPEGFINAAELNQDRQQHLQATRSMFAKMDVCIWTLGLTEHWRSRQSGAVYPLCPGVHGGQFDPKQHEFHNATTQETINDTLEVFKKIRAVNKKCRFIITVSPVPLIATALPQHVMVSTCYSKSILRVAAQEICQSMSDCAYFPSYELITSAANRGSYYAEDLREVTSAGVDHAMRLFAQHYLGEDVSKMRGHADKSLCSQQSDAVEDEVERADRLICEEEMLDD